MCTSDPFLWFATILRCSTAFYSDRDHSYTILHCSMTIPDHYIICALLYIFYFFHFTWFAHFWPLVLVSFYSFRFWCNHCALFWLLIGYSIASILHIHIYHYSDLLYFLLFLLFHILSHVSYFWYQSPPIVSFVFAPFYSYLVRFHPLSINTPLYNMYLQFPTLSQFLQNRAQFQLHSTDFSRTFDRKLYPSFLLRSTILSTVLY